MDGFYIKLCVFGFSTQNHSEAFRNYVPNSGLDPQRAKLDEKSEFGHVQTYCWRNKLRNTQGRY